MKRVLGLDISSTTIGLCALDAYDGYTNLFHVEYFKPPKKGHIFERLTKVKEYIEKKLKQLKPDEVVMEDFLLAMPKKTSANTIALLAVFNRVVGLTVYDTVGNPPVAYLPLSIRRALCIDNQMPSKEEVPVFLEKLMNIKFPWITKINRRTKKQEMMVENYDMSDSIAAAYSHILTEGKMPDGNIPKVKKRKRVEKKTKTPSKKPKKAAKKV